MQFFKRTRNRTTETSTATIPKMRISHTFCFQFIFSFCLAKILIAPLICTKVINFVSLSNERKGSFIWFYHFPLILFYGYLLQHGISQTVPWTPSLRCWDTEWSILFSLCSVEYGEWYCHLNVLCLTLRLGSFYVQSLIIGREREQGWGVEVLVTCPLWSHRTKEFVEEFTASFVVWLLHLNRASFGGGKTCKNYDQFLLFY
jgi:hypothetical protein